MKSGSVFNIFGAVVLTVLITSGCISTRYYGTAGNLMGTWKFKDSQNGPQTLTFTKDGVTELDTDGDAIKDIWGSYRLSRNWLFMNDVGGDFVFDCGQEGTYQYKVNGDELVFTLMADQCPSRSEAMSVVWVKVHKDSSLVPRVTPAIKI